MHKVRDSTHLKVDLYPREVVRIRGGWRSGGPWGLPAPGAEKYQISAPGLRFFIDQPQGLRYYEI